MKTYLFLFTLGPVQSFIAQARKAHDLHSGSKLLSDLCLVAAKKFKTEGGKIIFPDITSLSIPNRFLGKITTDQDLQAIGLAVEKSVRNAWKEYFASLAGLLDEVILEKAYQQIEFHFDIQWLFEPENGDYKNAYNAINQKLNALKNTRPFHALEEKGRKCSLDGERNVIFYRLGVNQTIRESDKAPLYSSDNIVFGPDDKDSLIKLRHLQPGEGLSAVSMLKRFQDFEHGDFPSTAEFALSDAMFAIRKTDKGKEYFQKMVAHFNVKEKELNWQVFFEENLNKKYFEKQGLKGSVDGAKKILEKIIEVGKQLSPARRLDKYYATLIFDGDHMGKLWSGKYLEKSTSIEAFQIALAEKLAEFAKTVKAEFEKDKHRGWVIYAGGDDFLGFFNLHHLLESVRILREKYRLIVHEPLKRHLQPNKEFTFSAGICIAHYKEPISLVLSEARDLEHKAKHLREKKDAFGIGVIPGSGQTANAILPFDYLTALEKIIEGLNKGHFSNAFVDKARIELASFKNAEGGLHEDWRDPAKRLLERALRRACNLSKTGDETEADFHARAVQPLQNEIERLLDLDKSTLENFFDALDIADFICRQTHFPISKTTTNAPAT